MLEGVRRVFLARKAEVRTGEGALRFRIGYRLDLLLESEIEGFSERSLEI